MKKKLDPEIVTVDEEVFINFFLGDILFTLLPLAILIFIKYSVADVDFYQIILLSEWPFASVIISSLALTRGIELKTIYQKDRSKRAIAISTACMIFVIFSSLCLALYVLHPYNIKSHHYFIVIFQFSILLAGILVLYMIHSERERLLFAKKKFPKDISPREFHWLLSENLSDSRSQIRSTCAALEKNYDFTTRNEGFDEIKEYGKGELNHIIEDIQHDLEELKERIEAWNKPPYVDIAVSDVPDAAAK